jgi:hypothetical protein
MTQLHENAVVRRSTQIQLMAVLCTFFVSDSLSAAQTSAERQRPIGQRTKFTARAITDLPQC